MQTISADLVNREDIWVNPVYRWGHSSWTMPLAINWDTSCIWLGKVLCSVKHPSIGPRTHCVYSILPMKKSTSLFSSRSPLMSEQANTLEWFIDVFYTGVFFFPKRLVQYRRRSRRAARGTIGSAIGASSSVMIHDTSSPPLISPHPSSSIPTLLAQRHICHTFTTLWLCPTVWPYTAFLGGSPYGVVVWVWNWSLRVCWFKPGLGFLVVEAWQHEVERMEFRCHKQLNSSGDKIEM